MALQIKIKNRFYNKSVFAVVRMDSKAHAQLKFFMHCNDSTAIRFKHGVRLCYRGSGWYRLHVSNKHNALEKLEFAIKLMRRCYREAEQRTDDALKLLAPVMNDPDLRIASFSNAHCEGEYGYIGIANSRRPQTASSPPPPVTAHKLSALVNKFQRPQKG